MRNNKSLTKYSLIVVWVLSILLAIYNYRYLLFADNLVLKYDWGFANYDWAKTWHDATSSWNDYFLGQGVGINAAWLPLALLSLVGMIFQLPVTPTLMAVVAICSVLAMAGMTLLLKNRGVNWYLSVLAGVLYAFAPVFFIRVIVGFIFYLLAYALAPFIIRYWYISCEQSKITWHQFVFPILFVLASAQPQFVVMLGLILLIDLFFSPNIKYFKKAFSLLIFTLFTTIIVHLPWLTNILRGGFGSALKINEDGSSLANIESLPHSIIRTFIGADHHITFSVFDKLLSDKYFVLSAFILIALAVFGAIKSNRREVKTFFITLAIAWPLALGTQVPIKKLFSFLYESLPFTNLFREVYHWSFLITISTIFLATIALGLIAQKIKPKKSSAIFFLLALLLPLFWLKPFWQTDFFGYIPRNNPHERSFDALQATHEVEKTRLVRSLFLPSFGFVKFIDDDSPGAANNDIYSISTNRAQIPYNSSVLDTADNSTEIRNALLTALHNQDENFTGLLNATAVNDIYNRPELTSEFAQLFMINQGEAKEVWTNFRYKDLLNRRGLKLISNNPNVAQYRYESRPILEFTSNPKLAASDLKLINLDQNIIYYEDLQPEQVSQITGLAEVGAKEDMVAAKNKNRSLMSSLRYVKGANLYSGLVDKKFSWWWHKELAYIKDDYVFGTGLDGLATISGGVKINSTDKILAKLWFSPQGEKVVFSVNNLNSTIATQSNISEWRWVEVPNFTSVEGTLLIKGFGEFGLANVLQMPNNKWEDSLALASKSEENDQSATQSNEPNNVSFNKINSGEYQVSTRLQNDGWLIFKMAYHPQWHLNGVSPVPINSYAMAWPVKKGAQDYSLIFQPQKSYNILQSLSVAYLLFLTLLAWRTKSKEEVA